MSNEMTKTVAVEQVYKSMGEIEHVIMRSGMYIGSIREEEKDFFVYSVDNAQMSWEPIKYVPGILKIIDEVISNSCDEYRRPNNMGLSKVTVTVDNSGFVKITDNGGIPVVMHQDAGVYVPEFIFGQLRTSSNYNDSEDRDVIGTNGIGSKIASIFATKFNVYTADGNKSYSRSWSNNMRNLDDNLVVKDCKRHFTEISFNIDFDKFDDVTSLSDGFINIIEKRCIDAAAANTGLEVTFIHTNNGEEVRNVKWKFKKFEEYIELYNNYIDKDNVVSFSDNQKSVWIYPDGNINIGFVNGAECSEGTHIRAVRNEINQSVHDYILTKHKTDIGLARNVDNKYSMFCTFHVTNPAYSSQTKECLTTPVERFSMDENYKFEVPTKFLNQINKSELVNIVLDWYKQKLEVEDQKTLRKLNKQAKTKMRNNDKFIDANSRKTKDRELWIFEGDSARAGFRQARNPQTQAAYMLRGVILNVLGLSPTKIMANKELSDLITILGLQWGQKNDVEKLNFGKIVIATDADYDGSKIAGLLLTFFNLFPELYEAKMICRSISPIILATKGKDVKRYYKIEDFKKDESTLKGYKILYIKGLGTLNATEYKQMLQAPVYQYFTKDDLADMSIKSWFGKGIAKERKEMLKSDVQ